MPVPFVDLQPQYQAIKSEIDAAIARRDREDRVHRRRVRRREFEREFAAAYGVDHCVSCANGTDAIYIALRVLGACSRATR